MADSDFVLMAEPLTPMLAMAQEAHKLLESYMKAGFTRKEAFDLTASQIPEWGFPGRTIIEEEVETEEEDEDYELDEEESDDDDVEEGY
jgi:hypothetical protein